MNPPKYDEVGNWSEIKLEIIRKYAQSYSTILSKKSTIKSYSYIDAFAGAGKHISKATGEFIPGSPLNALNVNPPLKQFYFIDLDGDKVQELRDATCDRQDVIVYQGDCNKILLNEIFPQCQYKDYHRALCLLDPYGLNVSWDVLKTAGQMQSIEIFYNFMIMDANMNVLWRYRDKVDQRQVERMNFVWGNDSWRNAAYKTEPGLFGPIEEKAPNANEKIIQAFRKRLKDVAGFQYVPEPIPMKNSKGAIVYYLFFASQNKTGGKIVGEIFNKYKNIGVR